MGLFGSKESKEEKQQKKSAELMAKYGLQNLSSEYQDAVKNISSELAGTGLIEFGATLSGMKSEDQLKVSYLNALIQQNWIIMRQLDEIANLLKK